MQIGFAFIAIALLVMFWGNKRRLLRAKRLAADLNNLRQGATEPASWANDAAHMEQFMRGLKECGSNKGLPSNFISDAFTVPYARQRLLATARVMERQGGSLAEQASVVCSQLEKTWANLSDAECAVFTPR